MKSVKVKFSYTWIIIALCFLMVFTCLGFCSTTRSLYLVPITEALGIPRSVFSLAESCQYVTTAIVNLFFGTLISRFGTKKLIGAGFSSLIIAMLLHAYTGVVWVFYLGSVFLGIGLSWTTTTMVGCIVNKWCQEKQGVIMGVVLAANGVGAAFATQIVSPMIYQKDNAFGYRDSYKMIVWILIALFILFMVFYKDKEPAHTYKASEVSRKYGSDAEVFREFIRKPYFYVVIVCVFLSGGILQGIYGVFPAYMKDMGLEPTYVVLLVSVCSLMLAVAKFLTGVVYDKCGLRFVASSCYVLAIVSMLLLLLIKATELGRVLALIYTIIYPFSIPLLTVILPFFAKDIFNPRAYNLTLGLLVSVNTAGYACGIPLINWVFDVCGSYKPIFFISSIIMSAVTICFQFVVSTSKKISRNG